jgi:excisionase family DNA binding protein
MKKVEQLVFSIEETAELLGISRQTIYKMIRAGELPTVRIYRAPRIRRLDIERLISEGNPSLRMA